MSKLKRYSIQIIGFAAELLLGIVLLIDPEGFTSAVITIAGAFALVAGVVLIVKYFGMDPLSAMMEYDLSSGLFFIAVGVICIFRTSWVIETFSAITVLYGIATLIFGFVKIENTVDLLRLKERGWVFSGINAILTVVFAVIILIDPFETLEVLCRFMGASLVVISLLDFAAMIVAAVASRRADNDDDDNGDDDVDELETER